MRQRSSTAAVFTIRNNNEDATVPNRKRLVVLVAEDHPVNQKVLGLLLQSLGVAYDCANDGMQAVDAATRFNYGLILMDCMMPGMDGFEASFEIRKFEFHKTRHTPIIACTALDRDRILDQCVRSGINDYIAKPIDRELLKEKIAFWSLIPMTLGPLTPSQAAQIRRLETSDRAEPIDRDYLNLLYDIQQLDDVLDLFMSVTETLLAELGAAIHRQDIAIVRRMVHEIKGSSVTVSAGQMAHVCRELEQASEDQDWPTVEKLYVALGLAFARVCQWMENKEKLMGNIARSR